MKMLDINTLISSDESEALDFKIVFHEHNIELIHDILCLANANAQGDRYLVFGVSDDRTIHGIQNDPNPKDNAMIQDLLRASKFNRIPTVRLEKLAIEGKKLAVLRIKNRPDKPFFLTTDIVEGKERIRAGVIYTRLGDTNIPLCEAAPEDHVELMWRERFGLGLHPLARLEQLVQEKTKWVQVQGESYLYHRDFPEFTICHGKALNPRFSMAWTKTFPDPNAWSYEVEVKFLTTILRKIPFVSCDGGRYHVPFPEPDTTGNTWRIRLGSLEYRIALLYQQYFPLPEALATRGLSIIPPDTESDW
jgi:hypothetical protein